MINSDSEEFKKLEQELRGQILEDISTHGLENTVIETILAVFSAESALRNTATVQGAVLQLLVEKNVVTQEELEACVNTQMEAMQKSVDAFINAGDADAS